MRKAAVLYTTNSNSCPESGMSLRGFIGDLQKKGVLPPKKEHDSDHKRSKIKGLKYAAAKDIDPQNACVTKSKLTVTMPGGKEVCKETGKEAKKRRAFDDLGNKNQPLDHKRQKKAWLLSSHHQKTAVDAQIAECKQKNNVVKPKTFEPKVEDIIKPTETKSNSTSKLLRKKKQRALYAQPAIPIPVALQSKSKDTKWDLSNLSRAIDSLLSEPPEGVVDIDEQCTDYFYCPDYAREIILLLQEREQRYRIKPDFLAGDPEVNPNMRSILIDWLVQVQHHLNLTQETLHLTVALIDLCLMRKRVQLSKLQLLGITCLLVASKFEERFAPAVDKLVHLTDNTYKYEDVIRNELVVLKVLRFYIHPPVAMIFLDRFLVCLPICEQLENLCRYLVDLAIPDYQCAEYVPSLRAAAAIFLARCILQDSCNEEIWTAELKFYSGYIEPDLQPCVQRFARLLLKAEKSKFQGAREKYANYNAYKSVSHMPELCSKVVQHLAIGDMGDYLGERSQMYERYKIEKEKADLSLNSSDMMMTVL